MLEAATTEAQRHEVAYAAERAEAKRLERLHAVIWFRALGKAVPDDLQLIPGANDA